MPWSVKKRNCKQSNGKSGSYIVTKKDSNKESSCHTSKEKAQASIRARYANEGVTMRVKLPRLKNIIRNVLLEMSVYSDPIPQGATVTILENELDISKLDKIQQDLEPNIKPKGLFYGCGSEWADFVNNPSNEMGSWHKKGKFMYSLKVKYTSLDKPDQGAVLKES